MADSTVAMTSNPWPKGTDTTQRRVIVYGTATITANAGTSPATGLPLNFGAIIDGNFGSGTFRVPQVGPTQIASGAQFAEFTSTTGTAEIQTYRYDPTNNSLVVLHAGAPVTTGIVADTLSFKAEFVKGGF